MVTFLFAPTPCRIWGCKHSIVDNVWSLPRFKWKWFKPTYKFWILWKNHKQWKSIGLQSQAIYDAKNDVLKKKRTYFRRRCKWCASGGGGGWYWTSIAWILFRIKCNYIKLMNFYLFLMVPSSLYSIQGIWKVPSWKYLRSWNVQYIQN